MAGEIAVASVNGNKFDLIFLFPITTPIQDKDSNNVVSTPASGLPATVSAGLTTEIADLDAGTMMFERSRFTAPDGWTQQQILTKVQQMYAARLAAVADEYAAKYQFAMRVGERFDAV
jgi:hypothetical protein